MAYLGTPIDTRNQFQSLVGKRFNGDGSTTDFTLDVAPGSTLDIEVFVGNVRQDPNSAYTLSGTTLSFTGAPPSGTNNIYVVHQAKSVGTIDVPALGVSTASIQADAITEAKIADDAVESEHLNDNIISGQTELAATPADTDELLISDAGTLKRIDFSHIKSSNSPSFSVHASNTNINDASETTIVFDTEIFDSDSAFASNTFTVPSGAGGKYLLSANCQVAGGATDAVRDAILRIKNGSTTIAQSTLGFQSNRQETLTLNFTGIFDLSASDALTCTITIDNVGGTSNYLGGSDRDTSFHGFKLA